MSYRTFRALRGLKTLSATQLSCHRCPGDHFQHPASELGEGALPARKDNDLLIARLPVQGIKHLLDTIIVRIDKCVVQDDWRSTPACERFISVAALRLR